MAAMGFRGRVTSKSDALEPLQFFLTVFLFLEVALSKRSIDREHSSVHDFPPHLLPFSISYLDEKGPLPIKLLRYSL